MTNIYKLDHPKATQEEIEQEAIEKIPTRERIQTAEYVKQLPPDTNAATFWLRNRKPNKYRDQNFAALNKANTIKANADAKKAKAEARISEYNANQLENSQTYNPLISELYELIKYIFTLVIAPITVGIVIKLFAYWLDKHNDNQK